ncbi:hypothetical protein OAS95_01230 [Pelagibacteraceae bacterium]|nr:hypothetical protein [Pelagibacteraceae bacterium]
MKQSLFISLLQKDISQSLFWGYELYYSGFQAETFDFVNDIYQEIYEKLNPDLKAFIDRMISEWSKCDNDDNDCNLGSIIYSLALRDYDIVAFTKTKLSYNITNDTPDITDTPLCVCTMLPEHIEKYKTHIVSTETGEKAYKVLSTIQLYPIIKDHNNLFDTQMPEDFKNIYHASLETLLFYAARSPVWLQRIEEHNGTIDTDNMKVVFEDDEDEVKFCELWDYEPAELPSNIQELSLGTDKEKQLTMKQFCKRHNYTVISKITKRKVVKKSEKA